ncbi:K02A2.6-like [Cordylochernes scorpioides]|uniref:K02A2.6-like n=1 Tax=Cordylochernes scorpioides TaxID=51811 RepID=A0ABY6LTF9_9ARAC|nr:K02A2.6-like [Cordylochernes scorpioides]
MKTLKLRQQRVDKIKNLKSIGKDKRKEGQKEAELAQENKSVIDAMMRRLERYASTTAARFDGSSSAESFLREPERSPEFQNSSCDEQGRMVVAALEGEPRRTLQSMDNLYEPYWRIKQKVRIGTQLNIDRKEIVSALTQEMPSYSRNILLIATPSSPSEWFTLARRIYGIGGAPSRPGISSPTESPSPRQSGRRTSNLLRRLSEDVPYSQKRPEKELPPPRLHHASTAKGSIGTISVPGQRADHPRLSIAHPHLINECKNLIRENIGLFPIDKFSVPALNIDSVKIKPNSYKIIRLRPYRIPYSDYPEIKYQIKKMLDNEIIQPSNSPYAAPVTLVRKIDGSKRF